MGPAGSQSLNPDSAIYKLNRLWVNFVTSLKLNLLICEMVMTNLYLTRLKWALNNTVYVNCQWPKQGGWVRVSLNRFRQEKEWSRKIILLPQLLYRQKDSKCCFKGCVRSTHACAHAHTHTHTHTHTKGSLKPEENEGRLDTRLIHQFILSINTGFELISVFVLTVFYPCFSSPSTSTSTRGTTSSFPHGCYPAHGSTNCLYSRIRIP